MRSAASVILSNNSNSVSENENSIGSKVKQENLGIWKFEYLEMYFRQILNYKIKRLNG